MTMTGSTADAAKIPNSAGADATSTIKVEKLNLTKEWDKVFEKSSKVDHKKVTFVNRYGITLAADMYTPKNSAGKRLPALAVAGPFGAVKEQSSGLYAQKMAERGFLTIAFDPSPPILTPRISARRWTSFPSRKTSTLSELVSLEFAAGAEWRSTRRLSTRALRQRLP